MPTAPNAVDAVTSFGELPLIAQLAGLAATFAYLGLAAVVGLGVAWALDRRARRRSRSRQAPIPPPPAEPTRLVTLDQMTNQREAAEENLRWP